MTATGKEDEIPINEKTLYDRTAETYDSVRFRGLAGQWSHRRQEEIFLSLQDLYAGKAVFEVGCGTGRISRLLMKPAKSLLAIDPSEPMIAEAKKVVTDEAAHVEAATVEDVVNRGQKFDVVVMVNVFGRLDRPSEVVKQAVSTLVPGGTLIMNFPCITSPFLPFGLIVNARGRSISRAVTSRWYRPRTVVNILDKCKVVTQFFVGHFYVPLPRFLFPLFPALWAIDKMLSRFFPKLCPSVFVVAIKK